MELGFLLGFLISFDLGVEAGVPLWRVTTNSDRAERTYRLMSRDEITSVQFVFNSRDGSLLQKSYVDEARHIIAAPPGRHLWMAHPELLGTVENRIEDLLRAHSLLKERFPLINRSESGWRSFNLADEIAHFIKEFPTSTSIDQLLQDIEQRVLKSRQEFMPFIDLKDGDWLSEILETNDVVEPLYGDFSESITRIDAFSLSPLRALKKYKAQMLTALEKWAASGPRFPIEWFIAEAQLPLDLRLALLMLITHNHTSEDHFLLGVLSEWGPQAMALAALSLNRIYAGEREFWMRKGMYRVSAEIRQYFPKADISFLNHYRWREVNVAPKVQVLPKIYGFKSQNKKNLENWLPYTKLYHYYGAFIVAIRLKFELGYSDSLTRRATLLMGHGYKYATAATSKKELELMSRFYTAGANDALLLAPLLPKH